VSVAPKLKAEGEHVIERAESLGEVEAKLTMPYVKATLSPVSGTDLHLAHVGSLTPLVVSVVAVEAPVHINDLTKRLMEAFGVGRAGSRITTRVKDVVEYCGRVGKVRLRGEFLYGVGDLQILPRDRSSFSPVDKKIELVAPEEIDAALLESVRLGYSLSVDDAVSAALGLLGFGRATQKIGATVEDRLDALIRSGLLARMGSVLTIAQV